MKVTDTSGTALSTDVRSTILDEKPGRLPVMGVIRSGIKVLTKAAAENKAAVALYDAGVKAQKSFDEIAAELANKCQLAKALVPKNVSYFTARRGDFGVPEVADMINDTYSTDGPDGRHLYRIPVIFPVDDWRVVIPHALRCWSASELRYWSVYGPDGARYCMTRSSPKIDPKTKRAVRMFGGRDVVMRAENGGLCEPQNCPEYQNRACNLSGSFLFYMPAVPGAGCIEIKTNSIYSMQGVKQVLETVAFLRRGRISGLRDDGKPLFWLTKQQKEIVQLDPATGQPKRAKQWLIVLEADLSVEAFLLGYQSAPAAGALPDGVPDAAEDDEEGLRSPAIEHDAAPPAPAESKEKKEPPSRNVEAEQVIALREKVAELAKHTGIAGDTIKGFADELFQSPWTKNAERLGTIIGLLESPSAIGIMRTAQQHGLNIGDLFAHGQREHSADWFLADEHRAKVLAEMQDIPAFKDAIEIPF